MNYPTFPCAKCNKDFTKIYREGDGFYCWKDLTAARKRYFHYLTAELEAFHRLNATKERNRAQSGGEIGGFRR